MATKTLWVQVFELLMEGVIAAGSRYTAEAGAEIMRGGGNAVDAAVAAAFASFVAELGVVHLGGSGLAVVFRPDTEKASVFDFFSVTPGLGATQPEILDFAEVEIDFGPARQSFHVGRGSVAVPGNIFGLCTLLDELGTLPLETVLQPALRLALEGVVLEQFQIDTCRLLRPIMTHTEGIRRIFAPERTMVGPGDRVKIPGMAETLEALGRQGQELARTGSLARALLADQAGRGLLTQTDLNQYEVYQQDPLRIPYGEFEVLLPPLSSVGGLLTAFSLCLMECSHRRPRPARHSVQHLQLLVEVLAATITARAEWEEWLTRRPQDDAVRDLLSSEYVEHIAESLEGRLAGGSESAELKKGAGNTSHLSVIDASGMAVSLTTTAGETAGFVVPGTGFIPNNMLGEADLHPQGFHKRPPGQRIPTMMTPLIVLRQGQPYLVTGSGGSTRIRSAVLQVLNNVLDYGLPVAEAVKAPRVHYEGGPVQCELGVPAVASSALENRGYPINCWDRTSIYFGGAHSVFRNQRGELAGAGDFRRDGAVAYARSPR